MPNEKIEQSGEGRTKPERAVARPAVAAAATPGGHAVVVAGPAPAAGPGLPAVSRRKLLLIGFWTGMTGLVASIGVTILNSLYPRGVPKLAGVFPTGFTVDTIKPGEKKEVLVRVPDPSNPLTSLEAKIFLVRLDEQQAAKNPGAQAGMIYAFWRKCPHLGCTVPWNPTFSFTDPRTNETYTGWFRCPCHGSTYTDTGVKVFGPAPRSLDMFPLVIGSDGSLSVNVGKVLTGGPPLSDLESSRGVLPA